MEFITSSHILKKNLRTLEASFHMNFQTIFLRTLLAMELVMNTLNLSATLLIFVYYLSCPLE